ncbi:MAG TPA: hypothetical protein VGZ91_09230 [Candidatus Sulfotelmatobacter sp.]|jgi:hypothetical protein|nr:hypothetical protein [Candidatus Sulfotelmatobacter sp.]
MEQSRERRRPVTDLPKPIRQQVNLYALAASAAGVGILALAESAEAEIVYTPAHVTIAPNRTVGLDLNHDGVVDFTIKNLLYIYSVYDRRDDLTITPGGANANEILGHASASALKAGVKVGSSGAFSAGPKSMAFGTDQVGSFYCSGDWNKVQGRYLGLKFTIDGQTHFGWARLSTTCQLYKIQAVVTGYAYETVAGKAIVTGQTEGGAEQAVSSAPAPASLGMLAAGVGGRSVSGSEAGIAPIR